MSETAQPSQFDEEINRQAVPALKTHPMVLGQDGAELFAAGVADMDFKAPPCVLKAIQFRLDHGVFGYEAFPDKLLPLLCDWQLKHHGWNVEQSHVLRSPNVLNSLAIAASLFCQEGDGIIVQPPVFFDFYDIIRENHRKIISNPLILHNGRYVMDFDGLDILASNPRAKMLFLCNPHNPVGRVWSNDELQQLGEICLRHNVLVVSDEMHGDLVFSGHKYTPFASISAEFAANSITCLSPAKTFNIASCCSAFTVISNDDRRKALQLENSRLTVNKNNAFANVAMEAAFEEGASWLQELMAYIQQNVDLVDRRLGHIQGVNLIKPEGTFLVWLDFRELDLEPKQLTQFLRQNAGWAITRGEAFGDEGEGFARLNVACPQIKLEHALDQLAKALS